jgi:hypothetical protein
MFLSLKDCCVVEMNTGGKSFRSPYVARKRTKGKVTVEIVPESTARMKSVMLAGKMNERRTYPAEAEETTSSFLMTNCSTSDSDFSFYFLQKMKRKE